MLGVVTGAVAGLGAITPACGYVGFLSAIPIGMISSFFCFLAVTKLKPRLGYDDSLDVFGVHGVGGMWGILATGIFAQKAINGAGADGLLFGNVKFFLVQGLYLISGVVYAVVATWILFKFVDYMMGMRVDAKKEIIGLDLTQHSEAAYTVIE